MNAFNVPSGATIQPLSAKIGAEVSGLDLSIDLEPAVLGWIRQMVLQHGVLVFHRQQLEAPRFHSFASRFGSLQHHVLRKYRHQDFPGLSWLTNVAEDGTVDAFGVVRATTWHTDGSYTPDPPAMGILHALEVPSVGAGTLFASMTSAYRELAADKQTQIANLIGLHRHGAGPGGGMYDRTLDDDQDEKHHDVRHALRRQHPETGVPALYANATHTRAIEGMASSESLALLSDLVDGATRDEVVYHHHWQVGDLLMWDEHGTVHRGEGAYNPTERRIMLRAIVQAFELAEA